MPSLPAVLAGGSRGGGRASGGSVAGLTPWRSPPLLPFLAPSWCARAREMTSDLAVAVPASTSTTTASRPMDSQWRGDVLERFVGWVRQWPAHGGIPLRGGQA
eukprot:1752176-Pyramimonas_sp.AAC.1